MKLFLATRPLVGINQPWQCMAGSARIKPLNLECEGVFPRGEWQYLQRTANKTFYLWGQGYGSAPQCPPGKYEVVSLMSDTKKKKKKNLPLLCSLNFSLAVGWDGMDAKCQNPNEASWENNGVVPLRAFAEGPGDLGGYAVKNLTEEQACSFIHS